MSYFYSHFLWWPSVLKSFLEDNYGGRDIVEELKFDLGCFVMSE